MTMPAHIDWFRLALAIVLWVPFVGWLWWLSLRQERPGPFSIRWQIHTISIVMIIGGTLGLYFNLFDSH